MEQIFHEVIELIKPTIPIITFVLGIFLSPFIENRKQKALTNRMLNTFKTELQDEMFNLEKHIRGIANFIISTDKEAFVPRSIKLHLLKSVQENIFLEISRQQRSDLRSIEATLNFLEELHNEMAEALTNNKAKMILLSRRWLYSSACLHYTIRRFLYPKITSTTQTISDKHAIDVTMAWLSIKLSHSDLFAE